jgi:hypothetical protein
MAREVFEWTARELAYNLSLAFAAQRANGGHHFRYAVFPKGICGNFLAASASSVSFRLQVGLLAANGEIAATQLKLVYFVAIERP